MRPERETMWFEGPGGITQCAPVVPPFARTGIRIAAALLVATTLGGWLCGCASRSRTQARVAAAAFAAGQRAAFDEVAEARRVHIRVLGPVRFPEVQWVEGLTLAEAIVAADYTWPHDPRAIYIVRQRERVFVDPQRLLRGEDLPLEPGDTIEIQP